MINRQANKVSYIQAYLPEHANLLITGGMPNIDTMRETDVLDCIVRYSTTEWEETCILELNYQLHILKKRRSLIEWYSNKFNTSFLLIVGLKKYFSLQHCTKPTDLRKLGWKSVPQAPHHDTTTKPHLEYFNSRNGVSVFIHFLVLLLHIDPTFFFRNFCYMYVLMQQT